MKSYEDITLYVKKQKGIKTTLDQVYTNAFISHCITLNYEGNGTSDRVDPDGVDRPQGGHCDGRRHQSPGNAASHAQMGYAHAPLH